MTTNRRFLRNLRNPIGCMILLAALVAAAGCSTSNTTGGGGTSANHLLPDGTSVAGWTNPAGGSLHAISATKEYASSGTLSSCAECHGADLAGGISKVSCFGNPVGCHHGTIPGWSTPQVHGVSAKSAPGDGSFFACQICHGRDFSGGGTGIVCANCHGAAPHPSAPWLSATGLTHTTTNTLNAPVCALCHYPGSPNNPANHPLTPAPAGTPPGCFNSTLCHGAAAVPHPVGSAWVATSPAAQPHGNSAKATPAATAGFAYCQVCHGTGTNFAGGSSGVSCYTCHVPTANSPHASQWRTGDTYVHTTTAAGNAPVCAFCHLNGANSPIAPPSPPAPAGTAPGCFNSTLCHGAGGVAHLVPYNDTVHYSVTSTTFPGSCGACHDVSAPSTKAGPVCQTCHVAASPLTALTCTSCHASPPTSGAPAGAAYPNIAGAHSTHIALTTAGTPISCDTCHNGLGPSLLNLEHYNRAKSRVTPGDVSFLATYNAQSGASSFDNSAALRCSNVSCHGGQATPNWQTGTLTVNSQCTNCHVSGTTQFNSYNSGEHAFHVSNFGGTSASCTLCHNTTALAVNHFTALSTPAMEGPASATVGGAGTAVATYTAGSCTPSSQTNCHGTRSWQ